MDCSPKLVHQVQVKWDLTQQLQAEVFEMRASQSLGEGICEVDSSVHWTYIDVLPCQLVSDEVVADFDVLAASVELGVVGKLDGPFVVHGQYKREAVWASAAERALDSAG